MITKNKHAVKLGSLGGKARAESTSKKRRKEIASHAATKRWANRENARKPRKKKHGKE